MVDRKYWSTLVHNGVCLPPPYEYKGLSIRIRDRVYKLTQEAEEMAFAWVRIMNKKYASDKLFRENFSKDFFRALPRGLSGAELENVDFSEVRREYIKQKISLKRNKKVIRSRRLVRRELQERYGYAVVDGRRVRVSNWMVEPPGIFMGRGDHPLRGRWKPRVTHRDITLNLGRGAPIPQGNWGKIVHDPHSMWIAKWTDRLTGKIKYVWLHESSPIRQKKDKEKYDKALKLAKKIGSVRKKILKSLHSRNYDTRKVATACYLIDTLGLRVGDEKDPDEADTVGATTLRVEHVTISPKRIEFKFLGKDSVEWHKSIPVARADPQFVKNLYELMKGKSPDDQIFDTVSSTSVNRFLGKIMPGLTAKVFRTYHATRVVQEFLRKYGAKARRSNRILKMHYAKLANLQAARFCNHKRTMPKSYRNSLKRKRAALEHLVSRMPKSERSRRRLRQRALKLELDLGLLKETKEYNLITSLKNYIDPRIYKAWCENVGLDWKEIYPKSLRTKFNWVSRTKVGWERLLRTMNHSAPALVHTEMH